MAPSILLQRVTEDTAIAPSAPTSSNGRPERRECRDAFPIFPEEQTILESITSDRLRPNLNPSLDKFNALPTLSVKAQLTRTQDSLDVSGWLHLLE